MLRQESAEPGFWSDPNRARETGRRLAGHETLIAAFDGLARRLEDAEVLLGLADEGGADAAEAVAEASEELRAAEAILGELELSSLYFGEYDHYPAILGIHAGAGGVDAQDWAEMLLRMYQRYLSDRNYRWQLIQITPGEEAGIKSATLTVRGGEGLWESGVRARGPSPGPHLPLRRPKPSAHLFCGGGCGAGDG